MSSPRPLDNTQSIGACLDRHLVLPLLEFLQAKKLYPERELLQAKLDLLSKTNMVDLAIEIWQALNESQETPAEMKTRREEVINNLFSIQQQAGALLQLILPREDQESVADALIREKTFDFPTLNQQYGITQEHLKGFYEFARFQFGCGNYSKAAEYLAYYRMLATNQDKSTSALWGKLASEILMQRWDIALSDLKTLQGIIDTRVNASAVSVLQQRTWLLHWGLFVFFNHANGRSALLELFLSEKYLNAVQTTCPHLLRYLAFAVITDKRKRNQMKELLKVINQETYTYTDPITEFLDALFVQFDFEAAQQKLRECETLLDHDYFLCHFHDEFVQSARLHIFETYCRIHQCIDITMIADKLNMSENEAERWIVNLIRNAHLDAKIDSAHNQVILGNQSLGPHQAVIDRTKGLCFKTTEIASALQKFGGEN